MDRVRPFFRPSIWSTNNGDDLVLFPPIKYLSITILPRSTGPVRTIAGPSQSFSPCLRMMMMMEVHGRRYSWRCAIAHFGFLILVLDNSPIFHFMQSTPSIGLVHSTTRHDPLWLWVVGIHLKYDKDVVPLQRLIIADKQEHLITK